MTYATRRSVKIKFDLAKNQTGVRMEGLRAAKGTFVCGNEETIWQLSQCCQVLQLMVGLQQLSKMCVGKS